MRSPKWWWSAAAGVLLAACFPPFDLPWLFMPISVAVWFACTHDASLRTTIWRSIAFAMGFYLLLLRWMSVVGIDAWLLLALLQSLYFILIAIVRRWWGSGLLAAPVVAAAWVGQDWLRDHAPYTAFGWGQLAFANVEAPWVAIAPLGGQWATTALIVATGVWLGSSLVQHFARRLVAFGAFVLAVAAPLLVPAPATPTPDGSRLALVQAGVDHTGMGHLGDRRSVLYRHRDLSIRALAGTDAIAVVWPENASDADPFTDDAAARAIHAATDFANRPVLLGAVLDQSSGRRNATLLSLPLRDNINIVYMKQRLVPFGEFLPMRDFLTRATERVQYLPRDFVPGSGPGMVTLQGHTFGIVICFEIADEALVRSALGTKAGALIVQTNNATYAGTGQSEQQLRVSQFRARTFGVPVYVISTNGPTAVIDAAGMVVRRIAEGDTGVILADLTGDRRS